MDSCLFPRAPERMVQEDMIATEESFMQKWEEEAHLVTFIRPPAKG